MEFLQSNEGALCTLLSDHFEKVMEHVEDMITVKEHKTIGKQDGKERIKSLLAFIHQKGEDNCQKFVAILRKDFPEIQKLCSNKGMLQVSSKEKHNAIIVKFPQSPLTD